MLYGGGQEGKQPCLPLCVNILRFLGKIGICLEWVVVHALVPAEAGQPGLQGEPCLKSKLESAATHVCYFPPDHLCRQMT